METVYFKDIPCQTNGNLPAVGTIAPDFTLVTGDLKEIHASDYEGKRIVLNIFPSIDTGVCAASVRRFNQEAASLENTVVICISMDLPFAQARFCAANDIENVVTASAFRSPEFVKDYGVELIDGPLKGLLARSVLVLDGKREVIYRQLVEQITDEPDYTAALNVLKGKF
ncbi:MAG: thiol peroxidase [Muribaculaceae bacterium]|nr:thiol peroxidase [Muribaculaceae bacterium]